MRGLTDILRREEGASSIEYALVACLIAVAAYAAFVHMGDRITTMYVNVSSSMPSN